MKKTLIGGAAILAMSALVAKLIGALYRIPLTNIIGAEGIGMYQLIFPVYSLMLTLSGGGISVAISRLVAERRAELISTKGIMKSAFFFVMPLSLITFAVMAILGSKIAGLQGNITVSKGFILIAPALVFTSVSGLIKGWFQGSLNMVPTATSMLLSQTVKLVSGLLLAYYLMPRGLIYAVYGAIAGVVLSELITLVFLLLYYLITYKKERLIPSGINTKDCTKQIIKITVPITIGSILLPLTQFIDSFLIVNILKSGGESAVAATSQYGLFSGTVMSLVNMPIVLILSLCVAIVPAISAGRATRNLDGIVQKSATSIKISYVIGIPAALLFFVLSRPIIELLYPKLSAAEITLAVNLLCVSAFTIVFSSQMQIYNSLLQALDKTYVPVKNLGLAIIVKILLSIILIKKIGIMGAAVATLVMGAVALALNIIYLNKLIGKNVKLVENVSQILLSGVIITLLSTLIVRFLNGNFIVILLSLILSFAVYLLLLASFKIFYCGELDGVPFSKMLNSLFCKKEAENK